MPVQNVAIRETGLSKNGLKQNEPFPSVAQRTERHIAAGILAEPIQIGLAILFK